MASHSHDSPARSRPSPRPWYVWALHAGLGALAAWHVWLVVAAYLANRFFTHDVGHDNYMLYHTWHGRFFWSIVHDCPHFAKHFTPTYVLLVPFHAAVRHVLLLPILETLALASGAWAVAWMCAGVLRRARALRRGWPPLALAVGWLWIANPHTGSLLLANHFESFAVALGLWALAALANGATRLFFCLLVLTLGCKEDMAIYWLAFGLWWMLFGWNDRMRIGRKEPLRFGLAIAVFSALWLIAATEAIRWVAAHSGQPLFEYGPRYAWMGATLGERFATLAARPAALWTPLWRAGALLLPAALFLPCLAPATLLLLIAPAYVMGWSDSEMQTDLLYYYSYPFMPFLFLGVCLATARLARLARVLKSVRSHARAFLTVAILMGACFLLTCPTRTDGKRRLPEQALARHGSVRAALRQSIPPDASVAAQFDLLCQMPLRSAMYPLSEANIEKAEYWALDRRGFAGDIDRAAYGRILKRAQELLADEKAKVALDSDGLLILRRELN